MKKYSIEEYICKFGRPQSNVNQIIQALPLYVVFT